MIERRIHPGFLLALSIAMAGCGGSTKPAGGGGPSVPGGNTPPIVQADSANSPYRPLCVLVAGQKTGVDGG